jgi:hypothetical protein
MASTQVLKHLLQDNVGSQKLSTNKLNDETIGLLIIQIFAPTHQQILVNE